MTFGYEGDLRDLASRHQPTAAELDRLRARIPLRPQVRRWPVGAMAAAAVLGFVVLAIGLLRPREYALAYEPVAIGRAVHATPSGRGTATADGQAVHVRWDDGTLALDVVSGAGAEVRVETAEAVVQVVGTAFTVERGPFGTRVAVSRGTVDVACTSGSRHALAAGAEAHCLRDAGAGLGRVLALERAGATALARLAALEDALAHPSGSDDARAALGERRAAVLHELADRAAEGGACAPAVPWLRRLAEAGDVPGSLRLVQCLAETDRAGARVVLAALPADLPPDQAAAVAAWTAALSGS